MKEDKKKDEYEFPICIKSPIIMNEPNQAIEMYTGDFKLKHEEFEIDVNGIIEFKWLPTIKVTFKVRTKEITEKIFNFLEKNNNYEVIVDNLKFGDCFLTRNSTSSSWEYIELEGTVNNAVLDDSSISVEEVIFSIPNLREFYGAPVTDVDKTGTYSCRNILENDEFKIIIDKQIDYKERYEKIEANGGYLILYAGKLVKKKGSITFLEAQNILFALGIFLSFINGRRIAALFFTGVYDNQTKWCNYDHYIVDTYKNVESWTYSSIKFDNFLFEKFYKLWQDDNDRDFIKLAIHWYNEANSGSGHIEGSIILAQTAIELIYNWLLIENKGILIGKDANSIAASNKLRLLLSHLNINYEVPDEFTYLRKYILNTKDIEDAPEAIVQIRNAIVHSELEKRKKISNLEVDIVWEALELSIWYIEMSLLYILGYKGKYRNRCNYKIEMVPWIKEKII